ncbi:CrcB family protein [Brucella sp. IR073]|uniref:CrcB family protein n=1 Tax=unclassified Brucella TaxID=2632610 RepID=UPI003B97FA80
MKSLSSVTGRLHLVVGCGAGLGALLRFASGLLFSEFGLGALWATAFVNILGSFVITLFAASTGPNGRWPAGTAARQFVMGGICGGFTTFSTMSLDTFLLLHQGEPVRAVGYLVLVLFLSLAAAWAGYFLARSVKR